MSRTYSDPSYGSKKYLSFGKQASIDGTYQSNVDFVRHTFMHPCKVTDVNLQWLTGGTNFGADFFMYLAKDDGGTAGANSGTVFGTIDPLQATGTFADGDVLDASVTETAFSTGDDIVLQIIGTVGLASIVNPIIQYVENFEVADS